MARTFSQIIQSSTPTLVDFFAGWCGPCKAMKPELDKLKASQGDRLSIIKVDVDRNPTAAQAYQVQGVPTLILFRSGKMLWRQSGAMQAAQLSEIIRKHTEG
jgi:thioredoxin 1